jgi:hypothetical protein
VEVKEKGNKHWFLTSYRGISILLSEPQRGLSKAMMGKINSIAVGEYLDLAKGIAEL